MTAASQELYQLAKHHGPADGCQQCADALEASRKWDLALRRHRRRTAANVKRLNPAR